MNTKRTATVSGKTIELDIYISKQFCSAAIDIDGAELADELRFTSLDELRGMVRAQLRQVAALNASAARVARELTKV